MSPPANAALLQLSLGPVLVDWHSRVSLGGCPHDPTQLFLVAVCAVRSSRGIGIPLPVKIFAVTVKTCSPSCCPIFREDTPGVRGVCAEHR